jgi:CheY-like chemotaxis protein
MDHVQYLCVFVRATGARLLAAERLVCSLPALLGPALVECDLAFHVSSHDLVALLRFSLEGFNSALRDRLSFWTARAGGRALPLSGLSDGERRARLLQIEESEVKRRAVGPEALFEEAGPFFALAGAAETRRRSGIDRPMLVVDVGGPGWDGVAYEPSLREFFLPSPMAPPVGDDVMLVVRAAGTDKPVGVRTRVTGRRSPEEAGPGRPAGFSLRIPDAAPSIHALLEKRAPASVSGVRAATRFAVRAPVKVMLGAAPRAPTPPPTTPAATIAYATIQELQADFIENLSQGGAFVRSMNPFPTGSPLSLRFQLPNGTELLAQAVVAFTTRDGMGVRFTLDAEGDAALQAAIAHLSVRPRRAVVLDDDATFRQEVGDALAERGFEVAAASLASDGLRLVSEELRGLDLLLTDVVMPGRSGQVFVRTIRTAGGEAGPAIVVVATRMDLELERKFEAAGADAVLDKALGPELVAQAADAVLERKRGGGSPAPG